MWYSTWTANKPRSILWCGRIAFAERFASMRAACSAPTTWTTNAGDSCHYLTYKQCYIQTLTDYHSVFEVFPVRCDQGSGDSVRSNPFLTRICRRSNNHEL